MTRDQFLTEKVLGECWHEWSTITQDLPCNEALCKHCNLPAYNGIFYERNNDFSRWEYFRKLWNFCKEQEWWEEFVNIVVEDISENNIGGKGQEWWHRFIDYFINPDTFADAIARYKGWDGDGNVQRK